MFGRIFPGRLPAAPGEGKRIDNRIAHIKGELNSLSSKVGQGVMSASEANYRRAFLKGELNQLKKYRGRIRPSTPSYGVLPPIFESTRRGSTKPANKYVSENSSDEQDSTWTYDYSDINDVVHEGTQDDNITVSKVVSDFQATEINDMTDVPDIPVTASMGSKLWPEHWPGNHSPGFMHILLEVIGEIKEAHKQQVLDPRDAGFPIRSFHPLTKQPEALMYPAYRLTQFESAFASQLTTPDDVGPSGLTHAEHIAKWNGMAHALVIKSRLAMFNDIVNGNVDASNQQLVNTIAQSGGTQYNYAFQYTAGDKLLVSQMLSKVTRQIKDANEAALQLDMTSNQDMNDLIDAATTQTTYEGDEGGDPEFIDSNSGNNNNNNNNNNNFTSTLGSGLAAPPRLRRSSYSDTSDMNRAQADSLKLAQQAFSNSMRLPQSRQEISQIRQQSMSRKQQGANLDVNQVVSAHSEETTQYPQAQPERTEAITGLGGVFLKTRTAMGRLLG